MRLGFIGVGNIGTPMCRHLMEAGHEVLVYDVHASNLARMVSLGAEAAASPRAVAQACNVVFSSLPGPREIEQVALGADGIIAAARPRLIYVDLSINAPSVAQRICATLAAQGVTMLDAPVSGGVVGAERGTLAIMVGGDAQAFATCKPLLQHIGAQVFHVGAIGSGYVVKLVNNMLAFVNATAAYEGMLLGVKAGVDPQMIYDIVQASIDVLPTLKGGDSLDWRRTSATEREDVACRVHITLMRDAAAGTSPRSYSQCSQSTRAGACATGRARDTGKPFVAVNTGTSKPRGFVRQLASDEAPGGVRR